MKGRGLWALARTVVTLCLVGYSSYAVAAERFILRAGEHREFSRILFPLVPEGGWLLEHQGREIVVTLKDIEASFDIRAVYPRRAAHRVVHLKTEYDDGNAIFRFQLNCDCQGRLYALAPQQLLLDIEEPRPQQAGRGPEAAEPSSMENPAAQDEAVARIRDRLVQQIRSAAKEGLVSYRKPKAPAPLSPMDLADIQAESDSVPALSAPAMQKPIPDTAAAGKAPASRMGQEQQASVSAPGRTAGRVPPPPRSWSCRSNELLALDGWQAPGGPIAALGGLRSQLVSEFDRTDSAAVHRLARHYLAVRMAAEAYAVLIAFDQSADDEGAFLKDVAALMDRRTFSGAGPLLGPGPCTGQHGMFQALAHRQLDRHDKAVAAELDSDNALQSLPRSFRTFFASELTLSAIEAGRYDQAARLFAIAERSVESPSREMVLARGLLALHDGRVAEAEQILGPLVGDFDDTGVAATLYLARHKAEAGEALPEELVLALDGIAIERRYTSDGRQALKLVAQALLKQGRALAASERLLAEKQADLAGASELTQALVALLDGAVMQEDQPDSLELLLAILPALGSTPSFDSVRRAAARRLIDDGLPDVAVDLVQSDKSEEGQALLAEAWVEVPNPDRALAVIGMLKEGARKSDLRRRALVVQGRYAALARLPSAASPEAQAEIAWLAGDWRRARAGYGALLNSQTGEPSPGHVLRQAAAAFMLGDERLAEETAAALQDQEAAAALAATPAAVELSVIDRAESRLRHISELQSALKGLLNDG